jgi:hypothetical protein
MAAVAAADHFRSADSVVTVLDTAAAEVRRDGLRMVVLVVAAGGTMLLQVEEVVAVTLAVEEEVVVQKGELAVEEVAGLRM